MGTANFSICIDCALRTTISCLFDPKGVQSNQVYVERCQKVETGYEVRQLLTLPEHFVRLAVATVDRVGFSNLDPRRISLPLRLQKLSQALETGPLLDLKALADVYIMVLGAQLNNDVEAFPRDLHQQNPVLQKKTSKSCLRLCSANLHTMKVFAGFPSSPAEGSTFFPHTAGEAWVRLANASSSRAAWLQVVGKPWQVGKAGDALTISDGTWQKGWQGTRPKCNFDAPNTS